MASNQAFFITETGTWPNEAYRIALSSQLINPDLNYLPAENFFRFNNDSTLPINFLSKYDYLAARPSFDAQGLAQIDTYRNTLLVWNVSAERRAFNIGNTFNSLNIDVKPGVRAEQKFYSYLLYPKRLFLKPTGVPTLVGGNWVLNTQTVLLNTNTSYFYSSAVDTDVAYAHSNFLKSKPTTTSIPSDSNYFLVYNLSATRTRADLPLITFSDTYNPVYYSTVLETVPTGNIDKCKIRPDSTYVSYAVNFYAKDEAGKTILGNLGQIRPDTINTTLPTLKSSYIMNYDPNGSDPNIQAFQLLQIKNDGDKNIDLSDARYCVLSGVFDLSTSNFTYYSDNYQSSNGSIVNVVTGIPDTFIGVSYIADCPTMQFTQERWQDTVVSVGTQLGTPISTTSIPASINWTTKYPPHYYSYKVSLSGAAESNASTLSSLMETSSLTWYLYSSAVSAGYTSSNYTTSIALSSFITSDYNFVSYDLVNGANKDYIKFTPLVNSNTVFLSSLYCYYGNNLNNSYSLIDTPWIPASAANNFIITYPVIEHGELNFSIRPTLCSIAGYLDAYQATQINLAIGQAPVNIGQPIFISKIMEIEDYMEVDSSFLISPSSWPTRDLRNSYISWFFTPTSTFVSINAVDSSGNYLQRIPPLSTVPFNSSTWAVVVSGYGPQTTVINLSSQKYNEVTNLTSNSSLFNYFTEGKLLVGSPFGLNNYNPTRTIYLTAGVPYKGRQYNLPNNTQVNWVWSYNTDINYETIPVSAYFLPTLSSYPYGYDLDSSLLSSVTFNVTPPFKADTPQINTVNTIISVDTQEGLIQGNYTFEVDDFPDPSIFNTDFVAYYTAFQDVSAQIVNTRDNKNVITRPNNGTNNFTFSALGDVLPTITNATIVWNVSSNNGYTTQSYSLSPINFTLSTVSKTLVTLSALSAVVPGWTSAHNVQSNIIVYILDPITFYTPLDFLSIPEFFWINGRNLVLSDQTNYTLIPVNTAYENKVSNSQRYYLSANKSFLNDFRYYTGSTNSTNISGVSSYYQLVDIPYQSEFFTNNGLPISLTAYNDTTFPEYNGISYKSPVGTQLIDSNFNITSQSKTTDQNPLKNSPKLIPYSPITVSFTSNATAINLDVNRTITVTQTLSTNPLESPVQLVDGTITYTLSTYYWSVNKDIPAVNGTYDIFQLFIGDPTNELTVSGTKNNSLFLSASANVSKKIYSSVFSNYADNIYTGPRDIWNTVTQTASSLSGKTPIIANSNAIDPEIYLSTTYTLTGRDIFVQYNTPYNPSGYSIVAYMTDFGEPDSARISAYDSTIFYNYKNKGTFYISYSALYNDGSIEYYQHPNPVIVEPDWETYDPNALRFVEETTLALPYNDEDIMIQPNEWGDADIFNTSILRLQDNLDYLTSNLQTLNTASPTLLFGWLGSNAINKADGIRWYTKDFGSEYHLNPSLSISDGTTYFNNIKDAIEVQDHIFVIDGTKFRSLSAGNFAPEINFIGASDLDSVFLTPISIETNDSGDIVYVADPPKNKIYRFDMEFNGYNSVLNYTLNLGNLGSRKDTNKFNSPSELVFGLGNLFVLDYNNYCVKQYNSDLNWIHTYTTDEFDEDQPINIAVHPKFGFLYVLTKSHTVYVFDPLANTYFSKFSLPQTSTKKIIKMIFDEIGDFVYIIAKNNVYKYSSSGYFIAELNLPSGLTYTGGKKSSNRSILLFTEKSIIKLQDILEVHKVGEGLPSQYWSKNQLIVDKDELASDTNYNRCLIRMAQNLKTFRNSLNYKLVIATEQTATNVVTYFASVPIAVADRPVFDPTIESEILSVGVNELHLPQSINKELIKLYSAVYDLKSFLDITNYNIQSNNTSGGCGSQFCWSWKAMSCYNLTLPAVRICNINPITYAELETSFPVSYAPSKTWAGATSECCNKVSPPV
ncbi:MAG: hypothetical protein EBU90_00315 [Proteobacteria bacterium]|nr:hypothetical protein [Pseudomonadota bacterium]NBP12874.1 hypothetical protein [bacterium]